MSANYMDKEKEYLSQEKYEALKEELTRLKTVTRREVAERLDYAKSLGDLSENAEYHEARDQQADIEDRITSIEEILKHAVIVKSKHGVEVEIGSTVTIKKTGGEENIFTLVGQEEASMAEGKVSFQSPLGEALLGSHKGEEVTVKTPRGEVKYTIIDVK